MQVRTRPTTPLAYDERLNVPGTWWAVSLTVTLIGTVIFAGGFSWVIYGVGFIVLAGFFIVPLIVLGRARIRVSGHTVRAGGKELPLSGIRMAEPLDQAATRHKLGPGADPAAHLVMRSWVKTSVLVLPHAKSEPYWLLSTRHPQELAAALRPARG